MVVAYAPTNPSDAALKDTFYARLGRALEGIPACNIKFVLGDVNAQVGRGTGARQGVKGAYGGPAAARPPWPTRPQPQPPRSAATGSSSSGSSSNGEQHGGAAAVAAGQAQRGGGRREPWQPNDNGRRCLDFCVAHWLCVANSLFQHSDRCAHNNLAVQQWLTLSHTGPSAA